MLRLDFCHNWTPSQLITWERSLREELREWENDKNCYEARYDSKVRLLDAREDSALYWERALDERESHLDEREAAIRAKEMELSTKEEDLYSEAYNFRQEYRCDHKVSLFCLFVYLVHSWFLRTVLMVTDQDLVVFAIFVVMRASTEAIQ